MKTTFSKLAAMTLQQKDESISVSGFAGAMRSLLSELEGDVGYVDEIWPHNRPRFIPDAFRIDRRKQQVVAYEIEDTHLLTLQKVSRMITFYWWLEYHYWDFRVLIANRYGKVTNEVDLLGYFYASESQVTDRPRRDVLTRAQLRELQRLHPLEHETFIRNCLAGNKEANHPMQIRSTRRPA